MERLSRDIDGVLARRGQGRILRSGFRVVLAGPPNAGKSSLLNALSQSDVAIVSDEPGTTRDLKEVPLDVKGQLIVLIDSAGLRDTTSKAEAIGVARAHEAILGADQVLWLMSPDIALEDPPSLKPATELAPRAVAKIGTKVDLGRVKGADLYVSVATGEGITELLEHLYIASGAGSVRSGDVLISHERDREALIAAIVALSRAAEQLADPEMAAEDLRRASHALERLLGRMDAESVLDHLFSAFCIGK